MFTGMAPHELSATWLRALDERHQTLAEALGARGFATAGFVANQFYGTPEFGLGRGFHRYRVFPRTPEELVLNSALGRRLANSGRIRHLAGSFDVFNRKRAPAVNRELLSWLSSLPEGTPFFAFLNFFDAHEPYLPPAPYDRQFATPGTWRPRSGLHFNLRQAILEEYRRKGLAPGALRGEQDAYEGSIAYLDHHIGSLIDSLEQRGVLDNTIVIITSDHGEGLGENGRFLHGRDLSRPALHVPLIVSFPGKVPAGRRVTEPVSLQDLAATVVDLAGVPNAAFPGTSWAGLWADSSRFHSGVVISSVRSYDHQSQGGSVVDGGLHLVRDWDGRVSLFDLEADPFEAQDLADDSVDVPQVSGLRTLLDTLIRARLR
jgi:arylsulfatase A-like enzyme